MSNSPTCYEVSKQRQVRTMERTVIIPTLNEEHNIEKIIRSIYSSLGVDGTSVIIVDDNSTDRTHEIVRDLMKKYQGLRLIIRTDERGLATAVRRGALEAGPGPVVVMDADLSHDPKYIPEMLSKITDGYDLVIGSRYINGGKIINWPGHRIAVSRVATWLARLLLRVHVKDPMSGFIACRSRDILIKSIEFADYKLLLEILVKNRHLRVTEVPITFRNRVRGKSKLDEVTIFLYLGLILRLFLSKF